MVKAPWVRRVSPLMVIALAAMTFGCASSVPALRPVTPHVRSDGDLTITIRGLDAAPAEADLIVHAQTNALTPVTVDGISVSSAGTDACAGPGTSAAALSVDGALTWHRPLVLAAAHDLRIEVPFGLGLRSVLEGPATLDVAFRRDGVPGCLRVPLLEEGDGTEWELDQPWMTGVRLGGPRLTLGLRAGRWLGPVLVGLETAGGPDRGSLAMLAQARLLGNVGLDLGVVGWWDIAGTLRPRGSFRYGPRGAIHFSTTKNRERLGGMMAGFSSFAIGFARWAAAGTEPARTEITADLIVWWNPRFHGWGW